jgi:protein gp37
MPIDKRKMMNITNQLSSKNISMNTIYFVLILISFLWNAYNTYQYQILNERQLKLENILTEISPSFKNIQITSSNEQWFTKALHFLQQLTSTTSNNNHSVKPNKVRFVFLEMLIESLDTCV